ncbi:MAG: lipid-A-disaccharide synthase [Bacteroidaceae bacterium]|nr:lipid-A-disaccharide synthase [Bacteroidaceae bacterium]
MKYFLIAGEASGDLHAADLMRAIRHADPQAVFRCYGGDKMQAAGGELLTHYKDLAYMGIVPVLTHLPQILRGMRRCKAAIRAWQPHCVILVDYPGFNLGIAQYVKRHALCPVYYFISPKIWAWKEGRIKRIKRDVDRVFSILPFEVDFYEKKHGMPISYVGNPTVDEVERFRASHTETTRLFCEANGLSQDRPIIALLAGSRRQEIKDNLSKMCQAAAAYVPQYQLVLACAPSVEPEYYQRILDKLPPEARPTQLFDRTYALLSHSKAALVTSGTATLETALFRTPQVVCYYIAAGWLVSLLRRLFLKVKYISLVNLVADEEVVPELVGSQMNVDNVRQHLAQILPPGPRREPMLLAYKRMAARLGDPGAPQRAAAEMLRRLQQDA